MRRDLARRWFGLVLLVLLAASLVVGCSILPPDEPQAEPHPSELLQVRFAPDPIEGVNRGLFGVSDLLTRGIVSPLARGYRWIVPDPGRRAIVRFGDNLAFPGRFVNNLLQAKFRGAGREIGRFLLNSTIGLLGFFDPARALGIAASEEDFGQTFAVLGSGPGFYLFVPIIGPQTGRDAVGTVGDILFDPATYVPYLSYFLRLTEFTFRVDDYEVLVHGETDPYALAKEQWLIDRVAWIRDVELPAPGEVEGGRRELDVQVVGTKDDRFLARSERTRFPVTLHGDEVELEMNVWLHDGFAPLVFVLPGLGTYRESPLALAVAEHLVASGYTVACLSSPFNHDWLSATPGPDLPGYTPSDAADVCDAIVAARRALDADHPDRLGDTSVVGMSLGAIHALFVAADARESRIDLRRIVAIDPPVDPNIALRNIDAFYRSPLGHWGVDDRPRRIENALLRLAVIQRTGDRSRRLPEPLALPLPFDRTESEYLIGVWYRYALRSAIIETQCRSNLGVLHADPCAFTKDALYRELTRLSFEDYVDRFLVPYYAQREGRSPAEIAERSTLRSIAESLHDDPRVRVLVHDDDFVLSPDDPEWLQQLLGDRLTRFESGGHLGLLIDDEGLATIAAALR